MVIFPAPFGPSSATVSPRPTRNDTSRSTSFGADDVAGRCFLPGHYPAFFGPPASTDRRTLASVIPRAASASPGPGPEFLMRVHVR